MSDAYANLLLPARIRRAGLHGADAGFATELAYGTLRMHGFYDAVIAQAARRAPASIDAPVLDVLRLGCHQLLGLRTAEHAAVDESVALARAVGAGSAAGFVNAVLRTVSRTDADGWRAAVLADLPTADARLAVATSHPEWVLRAIRAALEADGLGSELEAALQADNRPAAVTLVALPGLADPPRPIPTPGERAPAPVPKPADGEPPQQEPAEQEPVEGEPAHPEPAQAKPSDGEPPQQEPAEQEPVEGEPARSEPAQAKSSDGEATQAKPSDGAPAQPEPVEAEPAGGPHPTVHYAPTAFTSPGGDPARMIRDGVRVQDEGSQLAALALSRARPIRPGERWLDLCAGPGGKTALLAAEARRAGAALEANELLPARAELVRRAVEPVDPAVPVHVGDGRAFARGHPGVFDRILLDAPCTGLGALRRRPEARWRRTPADVPPLTALQSELLDAAIDALAPGGLLAYVTCSPHPAETRAVVETAVRRGRVRRLDTPAVLDAFTTRPVGLPPGDGHAQLWPHRHGTDAMFIQVLTTR